MHPGSASGLEARVSSTYIQITHTLHLLYVVRETVNHRPESDGCVQHEQPLHDFSLEEMNTISYVHVVDQNRMKREDIVMAKVT